MHLLKHVLVVGFALVVVGGCSSSSDEPVSPDEAAFTAAEMVGYPDATRVPAHPTRAHGARSKDSIKRIVIHALTGYASSTIETWKGGGENRGIAAHYIVDRTGKVVQAVSDTQIAYHVPKNNSNAIGIEHEDAVKINGKTTFSDDNPNWATDEEMNASAKLVAWLCKSYNIPCDHNHVFGHVELNTSVENGDVRPNCWDYGWGRPQGDDRSRPECKGNHSDPGPYFKWARYFDLVKAARARLDGQPAPEAPPEQPAAAVADDAGAPAPDADL